MLCDVTSVGWRGVIWFPHDAGEQRRDTDRVTVEHAEDVTMMIMLRWCSARDVSGRTVFRDATPRPEILFCDSIQVKLAWRASFHCTRVACLRLPRCQEHPELTEKHGISDCVCMLEQKWQVRPITVCEDDFDFLGQIPMVT